MSFIKGGLNIALDISSSMPSIEVPYLVCKRCTHKWIPRNPKTPKVCPSCNSPYWDKDRGWYKKEKEVLKDE